jgi:16S rRNA (adenine1518-N6/adenine1519-N6)-dimethyltransferase
VQQNIFLGHSARKRFGQNFLRAPHVIDQLVQAIAPIPGQLLCEIGPGLGALTWPMLARAERLRAIEIDRDLAARLVSQAHPGLSIHVQDVLQVDFSAWAQAASSPLRIVGNVPYNISSPLLFHLLDHAQHIVDQHLMLQQEVVERMVATPGSKIYGRLSVMLQRYYDMRCLFAVPAEAFFPAPKVHSAVVRMIPRPGVADTTPLEAKTFAMIVALAFSQRRKILRNTLASLSSVIDFSAMDFDLTRRAEEVSVAEYIFLTQALMHSPSFTSAQITPSSKR